MSNLEQAIRALTEAIEAQTRIAQATVDASKKGPTVAEFMAAMRPLRGRY